MIKRIVIIAVILLLILAFKLLNLEQYLNLGYLKDSQVAFAGYYSDHSILTLFSYMLIYITATALSLPGSIILTLAGGALFGLVTGIPLRQPLGQPLPALSRVTFYRTGYRPNLETNSRVSMKAWKKKVAFIFSPCA